MFDLFDLEKTEVILTWLFPSTYLIHITEEYWAGVALSTSASQISGANLTPTQFLIFSCIALMLVVLGTVLSQRLRFPLGWSVIMGTVVMGNGLAHVIGTLRTSAYNPGLISGVLIWIPLGATSVIRLKKRMRPKAYWIALAFGIVIVGFVLLTSREGGKLFAR